MPQIHDSPPSTADPDPVRIALADPKVWHDLVRIATSYLRKACGSTIRKQLSQDADDIVNEVIQIALGKSASFDPALRKSVTAWLCGFIANVVLKRATRRRKDQASGGENQWATDILAPHQSPGDGLVRKEQCEQVKAALAMLNSRDRNLLNWRYYDDLDADEISRRTGVLESTIRVQLLRARMALKALLDPTNQEGQS